MNAGRSAVQIVTLIVYGAIILIIAIRLLRQRKHWQWYVPVAINAALTVWFYIEVWRYTTSPYILNFGDISSILRLETGLTILFYILFMPPKRVKL